jgi:hypothetical protein
MAAMIIGVWHIHASVYKVKPRVQILRPKLKRVEHPNVGTVRKRAFLLDVVDESVDGAIVVKISAISDASVDSIHLHLDFTRNFDFAALYGVSKLSVILRDCRIT